MAKEGNYKMILAYGRLKLFKDKKGLRAFDGVDCWKTISPYLLLKWNKHHKKIPVSLCGNYIIIGEYIVMFHRDKQAVERYFPIDEINKTCLPTQNGKLHFRGGRFNYPRRIYQDKFPRHYSHE